MNVSPLRPLRKRSKGAFGRWYHLWLYGWIMMFEGLFRVLLFGQFNLQWGFNYVGYRTRKHLEKKKKEAQALLMKRYRALRKKGHTHEQACQALQVGYTELGLL